MIGNHPVRFYDISCKAQTLAWARLPAPALMGADVLTMMRFPLPMSCARHFMPGSRRHLMVPLGTPRAAAAVRALLQSESVETQRIFCFHKRLWCVLGQSVSLPTPPGPEWLEATSAEAARKRDLPRLCRTARRNTIWCFYDQHTQDSFPGGAPQMNIKFYGPTKDEENAHSLDEVQTQEFYKFCFQGPLHALLRILE